MLRSIYLLLKNSFFFCKSLIIFFQKRIDIDNKELEGVFNKRYKMIKKLGEGAQGTVFVVEDLQENNKKYFLLLFLSLLLNVFV